MASRALILVGLSLLLSAAAGAQSRVPPRLVEEGSPPRLGRDQVEADVACDLTVGVDGAVAEASCEDVTFAPGAEAPPDETGYRAQARRYARGLVFAPAEVDGDAVTARVGFVVRLRYRPAEPAPGAHGGESQAEANESSQEPEEPSDPGPLPPDAGTVNAAPAADAETDADQAGRDSGAPNPAENDGDGVAYQAGADEDDEGLPDSGDGLVFSASAEAQATVAEDAASVAASDFDVDIGELRRVPRSSAQQMLTLVPGVLLTQTSSEGHTLAMFLRGFDAGEGEDLEVLVDGMPINEISNAHGHGYVDTLFVIPQLVTSLRVVQGPFDPSQGDFATAGTAEYRLGLEERGVHLSFGYGRFNELRSSFLWGPGGQSEGTFAGVSYAQGDGFGPNRSFRNASALARYEGGEDDGSLRYSVLGFAATGSWRSAGVIREDDFERRELDNCASDEDSQFFCFYDPNQGGSTLRAGLNGKLRFAGRNELGEVLVFGGGRSLRIQENFTGFLNDPRTDGSPQRGDNLDQQYDAMTLGARARYLVETELLGQRQRLEVGLQLRHDDATTRNDRRRAERLVPYLTEFDRDVRETVVGAYLRADARLTDWLSVIAGVRLDFFGFNITDQSFPEEDDVGPRLERTSFSASGLAASPRGTIRATVAPGLAVVAAAGLGARSSDAAALSEAELAPFARVLALEAGLDFQYRTAPEDAPPTRGLRLEARASAFATRVSQDLVFDPEAGRNSLLGPSARSGVLGQGRLRLDGWLDLLGSVTYTRAHLQPSDANDLELFSGARLPFIPSWVVRLDAAVTREVVIADEPFRLSGAVGFQYVGERPLPLNELADPFALVDLAVGARWRAFELSFAVQNLFDNRYQAAVLNYPSNFQDPDRPPSMRAVQHFSAGPPLTFLATLAVHLDLAPDEPEAAP